MIEYTLIDRDGDLIEFRKRLQKRDIRTIAIDFEGEYNLHVYGSKLCLVQVFDGENYHIIDPFGISDGELRKILEDKDIVKLFYGVESDRSLVYKQYGIKMKSVLDVKIFADILGLQKRGLDEVIKAVLGIEVGQKKKYQMHNWTRRPIESDALQYAISDVQYLFTLRERLQARVIDEGKVPLLVERLIKNEIDHDRETIPTIFKSGEFKALKADQRNIAREIYEIREKYAKELDCPPNLVLAKDILLRISKNTDEIEKVSPHRRIGRETWAKFKGEILGLDNGSGTTRAKANP